MTNARPKSPRPAAVLWTDVQLLLQQKGVLHESECKDNEKEFIILLRLGYILCDMVNAARPNTINRIHRGQVVGFLSNDNVERCLRVCNTSLQLPPMSLFELDDLYTVAGSQKVLRTMATILSECADGVAPLRTANTSATFSSSIESSTHASRELSGVPKPLSSKVPTPSSEKNDTIGNSRSKALATKRSDGSGKYRKNSLSPKHSVNRERIARGTHTTTLADRLARLRLSAGVVLNISSQRSQRPPRDASKVPNNKLKCALDELVQTELEYAATVRTIIEVFKWSSEDSHLLSASDIDLLFGNFEDIHKLHNRFSQELQACTSSDDMARLFLRQENRFAIYAKYCANQTASSNHVRTMMKANPMVAQLWKECSLKSGKTFDLHTQLLVPVQRILKYPLLFQAILRYLPETNDTEKKTKAMMNQVVQSFTDLAVHINQTKQDSEAILSLQALKERFNGYTGPPLYIYGHLLTEGSLQVADLKATKKNRRQSMRLSGTPTKVYAFCFEEALLLCKPCKKKCFKLIRVVRFESMKVQMLSHDPTSWCVTISPPGLQIHACATPSTHTQSITHTDPSVHRHTHTHTHTHGNMSAHTYELARVNAKGEVYVSSHRETMRSTGSGAEDATFDDAHRKDGLAMVSGQSETVGDLTACPNRDLLTGSPESFVEHATDIPQLCTEEPHLVSESLRLTVNPKQTTGIPQQVLRAGGGASELVSGGCTDEPRDCTTTMPTDNSGTYGSMAIVGDYHTNKGLTSETGTGQLSRSCDATGGRGATLDTPNPGLSAGRLNAANCGQSNSRSSMVGTNKNAGMRDANHRLTPVFLVQPTEDNETVEAFVDSGGIKTVEGHGTKAHPHICTNTLTHAPERSRTGANAAERSRTSANAPSRTHTHLRTHTHTHTRSRSHELTSVTIAPTRIRPSTPTKGSQSGEVTEVFKSRIYFKNKTAQYQDAKTPWQKRDILSHSGSLSSTVRNAPLRRTLTPLFCSPRGSPRASPHLSPRANIRSVTTQNTAEMNSELHAGQSLGREEESSRPCANRDSNTTAGHGAENSVNGNVVMEPGLYDPRVVTDVSRGANTPSPNPTPQSDIDTDLDIATGMHSSRKGRPRRQCSMNQELPSMAESEAEDDECDTGSTGTNTRPGTGISTNRTHASARGLGAGWSGVHSRDWNSCSTLRLCASGSRFRMTNGYTHQSRQNLRLRGKFRSGDEISKVSGDKISKRSSTGNRRRSLSFDLFTMVEAEDDTYHAANETVGHQSEMTSALNWNARKSLLDLKAPVASETSSTCSTDSFRSKRSSKGKHKSSVSILRTESGKRSLNRQSMQNLFFAGSDNSVTNKGSLSPTTTSTRNTLEKDGSKGTKLKHGLKKRNRPQNLLHSPTQQKWVLQSLQHKHRQGMDKRVSDWCEFQKQHIGSEPEAPLDSEVAKQNFGVIEYSEDLVHSHSMPTERTNSQESGLYLDRFVGVADTGTDPPTSEPSVTHTPPQTYAHAHTKQRTSGRQDKERDEPTYADGPVGVCDSLGVVNGCASVGGLSVQLSHLLSTQSGDTETSSSVAGMKRPLSQSAGNLVGFQIGKKPNSGRTSAHLDTSPMLSKTEYASTGAILRCADASANEMSISKYRRFFSLNGMSSQSPPSPICGNYKFGPFGSGGGVASPGPGLKQQVLQFVAPTAQCATLWTDALALGIGQAMSDAFGNHHLYINTFEETARCSVCAKLIKGSFHQGFKCISRECDIRAHAECRVLLPLCVATETAE